MPRRAVVTPLRTLDETLTDIGRGDQAALVHGALRGKVAEREAQWLRKLVADFQAGTLTDRQTLSAVAAIAEGRALLTDLTRTMRLGSEARQRAAQPLRDSHAGDHPA